MLLLKIDSALQSAQNGISQSTYNETEMYHGIWREAKNEFFAKRNQDMRKHVRYCLETAWTTTTNSKPFLSIRSPWKHTPKEDSHERVATNDEESHLGSRIWANLTLVFAMDSTDICHCMTLSGGKNRQGCQIPWVRTETYQWIERQWTADRVDTWWQRAALSSRFNHALDQEKQNRAMS